MGLFIQSTDCLFFTLNSPQSKGQWAIAVDYDKPCRTVWQTSLFLFAGWKIKKGLRASFSSVLSNEIIMLSLTKINHKEKEIGLEVNNYCLNFKYVDYPEWSEHKWFVVFFFHWEK